MPKFWGVNFQAPEVSDAAPPFIGLDVTMTEVDNPICENTMNALGAVAGAVNGVAGSIFTLLSFACK